MQIPEPATTYSSLGNAMQLRTSFLSFQPSPLRPWCMSYTSGLIWFYCSSCRLEHAKLFAIVAVETRRSCKPCYPSHGGLLSKLLLHLRSPKSMPMPPPVTLMIFLLDHVQCIVDNDQAILRRRTRSHNRDEAFEQVLNERPMICHGGFIQ